MARRTKKVSRRHRRHKGAGYSVGPGSVSPGYLINRSNSGPQDHLSPYKDCTGNIHSIRPGHISAGADMSVRLGLPGWNIMKGGKQRRKRGGAETPMATLDSFKGTPAYAEITKLPDSFPNPSGSGGSVANPDASPAVAYAPSGGVIQDGTTVPAAVQSAVVANGQNGQSGGRYGFFPGMGPLSPSNGIGTSPAPFGRIACEVGSPNPLNPDPKGVQTLYTAPLAPAFVTGPPRAYSSLPFMRGGGNDNMMGAPAGVGSSGFSAANFPTIQVGAADMMKYQAPTAGYSHAFQTFKAPNPVPALMLNTPYDARTFTPACIQTGAGRKTRRKGRKRGGAANPADSAAPFTPLQMGEITTRADFDGTPKLLPCKFGGSRKKRHGKKSRKSCKKRRYRK
jgi:hypothetical protein